MKVRADENRCQGHGLCNMTAPDVFDLSDEDGHVVIRTPEVPPELEDDAARGAEACPEIALSVTDE
ncbi:ferredoxin [Prauserella rugosa]|uniref:Ferredoxin n=1 Tax=Prauserella rugosa TaxID=43354 RepID=A0A660CDT2_9PSEU|nr:ferredoxin [Prauserella rugosa]KID30194.1 ferredoxin [Prauserella sp. Am3]KMS90114.1 ferredoxin [Streptomyces regensis]TWH19649.1 ferredoxin [Prauserella rugosa]